MLVLIFIVLTLSFYKFEFVSFRTLSERRQLMATPRCDGHNHRGKIRL